MKFKPSFKVIEKSTQVDFTPSRDGFRARFGYDDGKDGFSPVIDVVEVAEGFLITITDIDKTQTVLLKNGKDGEPGEDGKTPERGIDYWTEQDKNEIKNYVEEAILGGEW